MGILDLLKGQKTADQIAADITTAGARRAELDAEVDALRTRRAGLLLDTDGEAELDRVDHSLAVAYREIDRADAALGELHRRLATSRQADRLAALDAAYARAIHHQAKEKGALERYSLAATKLKDIALEAAAHSTLRDAENATLAAGGDDREVQPAAKLMAGGAAQWRSAAGLLDRLRLPDAARAHADIYPMNPIGASWDALQSAIEKARQ